MPKKSLTQLCGDRYSDPVLAQAVADDAVKNGSAAKIQSGELVLPSEQDAAIWHARLTGKSTQTDDAAKIHARLSALEQLVAEQQAIIDKGDRERAAILKQRIAELSKEGE